MPKVANKCANVPNRAITGKDNNNISNINKFFSLIY